MNVISKPFLTFMLFVVSPAGVQPATLSLEVTRSMQLSYGEIYHLPNHLPENNLLRNNTAHTTTIPHTQNGASTHAHDHSITPVSFKTMKTTPTMKNILLINTLKLYLNTLNKCVKRRSIYSGTFYRIDSKECFISIYFECCPIRIRT